MKVRPTDILTLPTAMPISMGGNVLWCNEGCHWNTTTFLWVLGLFETIVFLYSIWMGPGSEDGGAYGPSDKIKEETWIHTLAVIASIAFVMKGPILCCISGLSFDVESLRLRKQALDMYELALYKVGGVQAACSATFVKFFSKNAFC